MRTFVVLRHSVSITVIDSMGQGHRTKTGQPNNNILKVWLFATTRPQNKNFEIDTPYSVYWFFAFSVPRLFFRSFGHFFSPRVLYFSTHVHVHVQRTHVLGS